MRRTYKSKKETAGAIDPRDVLLTLDAKSSVFDAFYIQNIKQTKKDMSVGSTIQFAASNKVRKRKYVKRLKEQEALFQPRESTSRTAFLTPDKSFRVNKAPDLFDQLLNSSCNKINTPEPVNFSRKHPAIQQKTYIKKKPSKKNINYSNSDSSDSDKENLNNSEEADKTANTSDIKSYKLTIEKETKTSPKYIDESIDNMINNISIFTHIEKQTVKTPENKNYNLKNHSRPLQISPLCSTPFLKKYRGESIYRFSPINLDNSLKCINVIEDSINCATDDAYTAHKNNRINNYKMGKLNTAEVTITKNIENSTVLEENYNTFENIDETNITAASIIYESINKSNTITEIQSPILPNHTVNSNKTELMKLPTYLSDMQTSDMEPFYRFEEDDLVGNSKLDVINNKYKKIENDLVDDSHTIPNYSRLSQDSLFDTTNLNTEKNRKLQKTESLTSSAAESTESESFYDACNSNSNIEEQVQNIEPIVLVERLNDSIFDKYYSQMSHYSVENNDLSKSSESNDCASVRISDSESNKSSNSSFISKNSVEDDNFYVSVDDENNGSICSNYYDNDNSIESKSEDVCVSFVTTRRRNEIRFDSFTGLDNSIISSSSREFEKTVFTNKNILENSKYITLEENVVDNIDDTLNIEAEEINHNGSKYRCTFSESDKISKTELTSKINKILARRTTRESFRPKKPKQTKKNKEPKIEDSSEDFDIAAEVDQNRTENKCTIRESDAISETELKPKANKILTRKSARESFKAKKSKSPINNKILKMKENAEDSLKMVTKRSSRIFKDSSQKYTGDEDNIGNESISCEKPGIILQPGKRWERSLSIYRRLTTMADNFDHSILDEEQGKGRKYRQSVISTLEMQDSKGSFHNDSINSRRSTFVSKPSRSTIKIVKESNTSRASLCSTVACEELEGFLGEDCDDTIVELSKLSIADSEHEVTIIEKFHDTSNRRTTARDYVLRRCNQADVLPFDECYPDSVLKNCRKIGEGVYGEVFLWRAGDGRARVLKVIPIAGNIKVNGEQQKDFHEIISEIVIAMELSALRAPIADIEQHFNEGKSLETLDLHSVENATDVFNEVLRVRCVSGSYPSRLLELWELYDECRGSENDSPAALPTHQHYVVLELGNAGQDLESYHFHNAEQSYALFKQIAFGLAVAEESYEFEHRDLHWGNVLISPTEEKFASFVVRGRLHRVRSGGVRAAVIDYSLSRASIGRCALYNDLAADDALFDALGDYQFQLYRLMRDKLGNDWKNFEPYTNILWLHYIADKMITALRYTRTDTKIHRHHIAKLKEIKNRILDYGSAVQYVLADDEL